MCAMCEKEVNERHRVCGRTLRGPTTETGARKRCSTRLIYVTYLLGVPVDGRPETVCIAQKGCGVKNTANHSTFQYFKYFLYQSNRKTSVVTTGGRYLGWFSTALACYNPLPPPTKPSEGRHGDRQLVLVRGGLTIVPPAFSSKDSLKPAQQIVSPVS